MRESPAGFLQSGPHQGGHPEGAPVRFTDGVPQSGSPEALPMGPLEGVSLRVPIKVVSLRGSHRYFPIGPSELVLTEVSARGGPRVTL
jgi:hypothetical protein